MVPKQDSPNADSDARARAVVIGGGVCGLAVAMRLGQSGRYAPLVLESESKPGGLARSLDFKGVSTDMGPHRLHTEIPEVYDLISEICAPSLIQVKRKSRIYLRGKFMAYPPEPFSALMHLGPIRCARFGFSMLGEALKRGGGEETYESLMRGAFGPAMYEFMLRPFTAKVWKTDPSLIHADTARVRVSAGSLVKLVTGVFRREKKGEETSLKEFRYVRGGIKTLVRHLLEHAEEAGAELRVSRPVTKIELRPEPGGAGGSSPGRYRAVAVHTGLSASEDSTLDEDNPLSRRVEADQVISTVPLPVLLRELLPPIPELAEARAAAGALTYLNMVFVLVIVGRKVISGDNWLYFPEPEFIFNRAYEAATFDPEMGSEDRSVLCVELTSRPGESPESDDDDAIIEETVRQLASTGLFKASEVEETHVVRLKYGYPLYSLDYHTRLDKIFDGLRCVGNLLTSGRQGLFNHNNTDHSIYMGLKSADAILAEPGAAAAATPAEAWYDTVEEFKHFRIVD